MGRLYLAVVKVPENGCCRLSSNEMEKFNHEILLQHAAGIYQLKARLATVGSACVLRLEPTKESVTPKAGEAGMRSLLVM